MFENFIIILIDNNCIYRTVGMPTEEFARLNFGLKNSKRNYTFSETLARTDHKKGIIQGCRNVLHKLQINCRKTA